MPATRPGRAVAGPGRPHPKHSKAARLTVKHRETGSTRGACVEGTNMVDELWSALLAAAAGTASATGPLAWVGSVGSAEPAAGEAGRGWQLREPGRWDADAQQCFALFKPLLDGAAGRRPWVVAQLSQSLDGCIATRSGDSAFISSPEGLRHLHRLRALCDAVLVGPATVVADNPRLTVRHVPGPNPLRVLLDPRAGLADQVDRAQVFADDGVPTLWLCDARWAATARRHASAAQVLALPGLLRDDGSPAAAMASAALAARGCRRLLVEGGGITVSRFLAQGALDQLQLSMAPMLIGNGRRGLQFAGAARLNDCARPPCRVFALGADRLWDLILRDGSIATGRPRGDVEVADPQV